MKLSIDPDTTVGALLEAYPETEHVLVELAPAFAKLRNPIVRRTIAKVATLEQAAKVGGLSLQKLIGALRAFTGQDSWNRADAGEEAGERGTPAWVAAGRVAAEIDAGPLLAQGIHPIGRIREAVRTLGPGEVVLLRSSFRPEPLIDTMRRSGAAVHTMPDGVAHRTYFANAVPTNP